MNARIRRSVAVKCANEYGQVVGYTFYWQELGNAWRIKPLGAVEHQPALYVYKAPIENVPIKGIDFRIQGKNRYLSFENLLVREIKKNLLRCHD